MTRFQYPRHNMSLRLSVDLDDELTRCAEALKATKTDVAIYALCLMLDPTGTMPDVKMLPSELGDDFRREPAASMIASHFYEPDNTDWAAVLGEDLKVRPKEG